MGMKLWGVFFVFWLGLEISMMGFFLKAGIDDLNW